MACSAVDCDDPIAMFANDLPAAAGKAKDTSPMAPALPEFNFGHASPVPTYFILVGLGRRARRSHRCLVAAVDQRDTLYNGIRALGRFGAAYGAVEYGHRDKVWPGHGRGFAKYDVRRVLRSAIEHDVRYERFPPRRRAKVGIVRVCRAAS